MSTFVLVHGSWHGAWCWEKLLPLLEAAGHSAVAIDLPAHGDDETPIAEATLEAYAERIGAVAAAQSEPVVLVGHSMGGAAITQAVQHCPESIGVLVYLAAFVPDHGASVIDQALADVGSLLHAAVEVDEQRGVVAIDEARVVECFYGDCAPEDISFARKRLRDDPLAPLVTPLSLGSADGADVPRVYIECLRDAALTLDHQRALRSALTWREVFTLDTGHSPFFSAPTALAEHLLASADFAR